MELHNELPDGFSDLAPFLDRWRLTGQQSRMRAMAAADMPELRTFYDALLPRIDAIVAHLNQFPVDDLPPQERALFDLALTFAEVAHPVDLDWRSSDVSDLFPAERIDLVGPSQAW
ncbi:hypothetical protein AB0G67_45685 [Streptomyces sp. NPDC021056]|uniref:hypothetical protein n=1 Tax=Streptomyces TaxID=1883 RepID=UPI00340770AF